MRGWSSETGSQTGIGGTRVGVGFLLSGALFFLFSSFAYAVICRAGVSGKKEKTGKGNNKEISC